jgi:hypothetical protein
MIWDAMPCIVNTHHLWTLPKQSCIPVTIIKLAVEQIPLLLLHCIEFPHIMQRKGIRHASYPDILAKETLKQVKDRQTDKRAGKEDRHANQTASSSSSDRGGE